MVYLVTKRLKYPHQRSSDDGGDVVGGATVAYIERHAVSMPACAASRRTVDWEDGHPYGWPLLFCSVFACRLPWRNTTALTRRKTP